jgi:hypothetical protein
MEQSGLTELSQEVADLRAQVEELKGYLQATSIALMFGLESIRGRKRFAERLVDAAETIRSGLAPNTRAQLETAKRLDEYARVVLSGAQ